MALYGELKGKFEQLERQHFSRVAPDKNSFVIRGFRKESGILKQEWRERLTKELGRPRADLLDGAIQKGRTAFFRARNGRMLPGGMVDNGPSWLLRGLEETRLNFTVGERDGRPTLRYDFDMGDLGRGSGTARGGQIPKRWQHLVTPDMLNLPLAL